jgi:hypothetical protein
MRVDRECGNVVGEEMTSHVIQKWLQGNVSIACADLVIFTAWFIRVSPALTQTRLPKFLTIYGFPCRVTVKWSVCCPFTKAQVPRQSLFRKSLPVRIWAVGTLQ